MPHALQQPFQGLQVRLSFCLQCTATPWRRAWEGAPCGASPDAPAVSRNNTVCMHMARILVSLASQHRVDLARCGSRAWQQCWLTGSSGNVTATAAAASSTNKRPSQIVPRSTLSWSIPQHIAVHPFLCSHPCLAAPTAHPAGTAAPAPTLPVIDSKSSSTPPASASKVTCSGTSSTICPELYAKTTKKTGESGGTVITDDGW